MAEEKKKPTPWEISKSVSVFLVAVVFAVKAFTTPVSLTLDAQTLISLLLALFSIWLSALFYFKATETSNTFYDNTYKFTRDIAQLLAKMESGFGERLRNLDEGYTSIRNYFQPGRGNTAEEVEKTKQKLDEEKEDLKKTVEARNKIVRDLLERSQLQASEKEHISAQLKEKEAELEKAQQEVSKLNRKLMLDRVRSHRSSLSVTLPDNEGMNSFATSQVVEKIGKEKIATFPVGVVKRQFDRLIDNLPKRFLEDLEQHGFYDGGLTNEGVGYLRALARRDDI